EIDVTFPDPTDTSKIGGLSESLLKYSVSEYILLKQGTSLIQLQTINDILLNKIFISSSLNPEVKIVYILRLLCAIPEHDMIVYDNNGIVIGIIHILTTPPGEGINLLSTVSDMIFVEPIIDNINNEGLKIQLLIDSFLDEPSTLKFYHQSDRRMIENPCPDILTQEGNQIIITLDLKPRDKLDFNCVFRLSP